VVRRAIAANCKAHHLSRAELGGLANVYAVDDPDDRVAAGDWMVGQEQYRLAVGRYLDGAGD
jgi:hypothetical protein